MTKYEFRDVQFMTAREKELVLKSWVRFLKHGLRFQNFSERLYRHLHLHCGFIAHYNRLGFYQTYFENGEDTAKFLSQFDKRGECRGVESNIWRGGEYEDLAEAMIAEAVPYIPKLTEQALAKQRQSDLTTAEELAAKHGAKVDLTN